MHQHPIVRYLPVIDWKTAQEWDPVAGEIPQDKILGWRATTKHHTEHAYVLRVEDLAMAAPSGISKSYPPGCYIFVDVGRAEEVSPGKRCIARLLGSGLMVFRTYQADPISGKRWLEPLNPQFGVLTEPFTIVGLVTAKQEDEDE